MNHLPIPAARGLAVVALAACLSSCAISSKTYVNEIRGYSVTRGRITRIENLYAEEFQALSDGVAMKLVEDGCTVTMQFKENDDQPRVFEIGTGVILVKGYDGDYILESRSGGGLETTEQP